MPTRQSYTMTVVDPDGRSAAAGVAISPSILGALMSYPALLNVPFYLAGGLKIIYDLLLYRSFKTRKRRKSALESTPSFHQVALYSPPG